MNETAAHEETAELVLEYKLDASPEKLWRAISIPAFREQWLPEGELAEPDPVFAEPEKEIRYLMRDDTPPYLESLVTFQIRHDANDGTTLRIIHERASSKLSSQRPRAANSNEPIMMCAA